LTKGRWFANLYSMARLPLVAALIVGLALGAPGCQGGSARQPSPLAGGVTIPELAPPPGDRPPPPQFLVSVGLEIHVLDLPADNIDQLQNLWQILSAAPIRLMSYNAFSENYFRLLAGKIEMWERIQTLLAQADAQPVTTVSLTVAANDKTDLPIAPIPLARPIAFIGTDLSKQAANVGPGLLALRLVAEPIPWARSVRKVIGCPVYTLPTSGAIPELQAQSLRREFYFAPAAFAGQMGPGDLLVLGPEKYTGERATLGGLFFNKPEETLFFNPNKPKPPERKPAVRVYILVCTHVSGQ
jgi:hypothetical protein